MSVLWVDLDLSNYLPLSDSLLLDVSTFLLGACDFSDLLTVLIFFFCNERSDGFLRHVRFFSHASIPLFDNCVGSSDKCLFGFILIGTFSHRYTWIIRFLLQGIPDIWRNYLSAWSYLPGKQQNQSHILIVLNLVSSIPAI